MSYVLKHKQDLNFLFLACKTLRAVVRLFFSNFIQSFFSNGKFISSQLYLFIKGVMFVVYWGSFFISSYFNTTARAYWKHFLSFLLKGFIVFLLSSQENLYMIHHDSDLFYNIYNTTNEHNWTQTTFDWFQISFFYLFLSYLEIYFITLSASSLIIFLCYHFLNPLHALHHYL